jgi:hypothetical protein
MKEIALLKTLFDDGERKEYTRAVANNEFPPGKWSRVLVQELPKRASRGGGFDVRNLVYEHQQLLQEYENIMT